MASVAADRQTTTSDTEEQSAIHNELGRSILQKNTQTAPAEGYRKSKRKRPVQLRPCSPPEDSTQPTAAKPFSCESCGKRFKVLGGLEYHTAKAVCKQVSLLPLPALSGTKDVHAIWLLWGFTHYFLGKK